MKILGFFGDDNHSNNPLCASQDPVAMALRQLAKNDKLFKYMSKPESTSRGTLYIK